MNATEDKQREWKAFLAEDEARKRAELEKTISSGWKLIDYLTPGAFTVMFLVVVGFNEFGRSWREGNPSFQGLKSDVVMLLLFFLLMLNAWNQAEGKVAHRKLVALKEYIDLRIAALEGEAGSKGGLKDAGKGPPL